MVHVDVRTKWVRDEFGRAARCQRVWPAGHPARGARATREIRAGMTGIVNHTHTK